MKKHLSARHVNVSSCVLLAMCCVVATANAAQPSWPREIVVPEGKIVMYQPQLESFKDNKLTGRAAVAVTPSGKTEPVFGAVWLEVRVLTDRDTRIVTLVDINVTQAKFPNATADQIGKLKAILENEIPKWDLEVSLDRLLTMLDVAEKEKATAEGLNTDPPKIIVKTHPAVLIIIDGQPKLSKVDNSELMRVVNTPFLILFDPKTKSYYLKGGKDWLKANDIMGPWDLDPYPPTSVTITGSKLMDTGQEDDGDTDLDKMPQIIVSTEPAELIVLDDAPTYASIYGVDIFYVSNTESDLFMHIDTQQYYVLLSGRWYTCESLTGQWSFIPGGNLPEDFAKIPPGSAKDHVLASVPDTVQAKEAVLESYIPQTVTVKRSEAEVTVEYDGDPKFENIEGTDMRYAVNTSYSVIRYGSKFYCCDDGIWFVSGYATGPWEVCVAVPQAIYTIPPSCPIYNVKYVYVYDSTPDVVYVGYTPGYVGCYVYGGTVVYGTGYHYHGWYGHHYYHRPHTWGVAVSYNPHTGNWGFRAGYRSGGGWFVGGAYRSGWWGAGGHRDIDIDVHRNINIDRSRNNLYNRRGDLARRPGAGRPGVGRPGTGRPGVGKPGTGRPGVGKPGTGSPGVRRPVTTQGRKNNVFAGSDGNVHRKTDKGWQQKTSSGWSDRKPASSTGRRTTSSRPSSSNLDRHNSSRQRGSTRTNNYRNSRSSSSRNRSYGSSRGGGGRRSYGGGRSRGGGGRRR